MEKPHAAANKAAFMPTLIGSLRLIGCSVSLQLFEVLPLSKESLATPARLRYKPFNFPPMSEAITLYRVFLATPSDVSEELIVVEALLRDWNLQHGQAQRVRLESVNWRTHTRPAFGKRPQALVNKQAFDTCDLVVAIFCSRFGTPTRRAGSGTEEEIRRGIKQGKEVLVYFSERPSPGQKPTEHSRIEKFKRKFRRKALFWSYSDTAGFEQAFRNHLAFYDERTGETTRPPRLMKARSANVIHSTGRNAFVIQGSENVSVHLSGKKKPKMEYPSGSIGADLVRRNYVRYLIERYFRYREADASFGRKAVRRFSYAVLFKIVESHFKAPTYFIPIGRFDELVDFLQRKVEGTILGKRNRARGHRNFETFDEFQLGQTSE
jgi:hypothetical protein